jgi:hypothetical protein
MTSSGHKDRKFACLRFSLKFTTMTARRFGLVVSWFFAGIGLAMSGAKEPPVIVDLHAHRGEIRAGLLEHTPVGSGVKDAMDFISKQLQRAGGTAPVTVEPVKDDSQSRAAKTIRVYLGQYFDHPEVVFLSAPLMMQKEVTGQWLFDSRDRLIDIVVDKQNRLY